jgi:hypothetical protein
MEDMKLWHARKHGRTFTVTYMKTWKGNILRWKHAFRNETLIQLRGDKKRRHLAILPHHHVRDNQQTEFTTTFAV